MIVGRILLILGLVWLSDESDWGYEGEKSPVNWERLFPEACSGRYQSPIDINTSQSVYNPQLKDFVIFFDPPSADSRFYVHNNGHAVQIDTEGEFYVSNGGLPDIYRTAQFHFHWGHKNHHGSEHTVDGKAAPIEMHIVNWNTKFASIGDAATKPEGLAVLGILFEVSEVDNPDLEPIVKVLMEVRDPDMKIRAKIPAQSMRRFLPAAPEWYYRYSGSLTTPKCFESVIWTVFKEKQTISRRQLHVFRQVLKPKHHKRHLHKSTRAEKAVFEELGIMDNPVEKARLKRNLEAKMQADSTAAKETVVLADPLEVENNSSAESPKYETHEVSKPQDAGLGTDHPSGHQDGGHHKVDNHQSGPPTRHPSTVVEQNDMEVLRNILVNNYRPVQPLNGRTVYRSFPFFDAPIPGQSKSNAVIMKEPVGGSSTVTLSMLSLAGALFLKFL